MALIKDINSKPELDALLIEKKDGLVVIDFHATWCGPCHAIAPVFVRLSEKYRNVTFTRVDVDKVPTVARHYTITAMPTFLFIKNSQVVEQLKGADPKGLENAVQKHGQSTTSAASSSGVSGSASTDAHSSDLSLLEHLDLSQINCLNEAENHTLKSICSSKGRNATSAFLVSDADEQLLLNIHFNQTVRVRSIVLQSSKFEQAPKVIKLLVNRPSVGFDDVEDAKEPEMTQILELTEEQVKEGKHIPLRFVRFQAVDSLHIFVVSNQGGEDETRIDAVDVFGVPVQATRDLSGLKGEAS